VERAGILVDFNIAAVMPLPVGTFLYCPRFGKLEIRWCLLHPRFSNSTWTGKLVAVDSTNVAAFEPAGKQQD